MKREEEVKKIERKISGYEKEIKCLKERLTEPPDLLRDVNDELEDLIAYKEVIEDGIERNISYIRKYSEMISDILDDIDNKSKEKVKQMRLIEKKIEEKRKLKEREIK